MPNINDNVKAFSRSSGLVASLSKTSSPFSAAVLSNVMNLADFGCIDMY